MLYLRGAGVVEGGEEMEVCLSGDVGRSISEDIVRFMACLAPAPLIYDRYTISARSPLSTLICEST